MRLNEFENRSTLREDSLGIYCSERSHEEHLNEFAPGAIVVGGVLFQIIRSLGLNLTRKNAGRISQWLKNNPNQVNNAVKELQKNKKLNPNQFKPADKTIRKQDKDLFVGGGTKIRKEPDITGVYTTGPNAGKEFKIPGRFRPQGLKRKLTNKEKEEIAKRVQDKLRDIAKNKKDSGGGSGNQFGGGGGGKPPSGGSVSGGDKTPKKFQGGGKDVRDTKKTIDKVNKRIDQVIKKKDDKNVVDKIIGGIKNIFGFGSSTPKVQEPTEPTIKKPFKPTVKIDQLPKIGSTITNPDGSTTYVTPSIQDKIKKEIEKKKKQDYDPDFDGPVITKPKQTDKIKVEPLDKIGKPQDKTKDLPKVTTPKTIDKVKVVPLDKLGKELKQEPKLDRDLKQEPKLDRDLKQEPKLDRDGKTQNRTRQGSRLLPRQRFRPLVVPGPQYVPYDKDTHKDIIYKGTETPPDKGVLKFKAKRMDKAYFDKFKDI